MVYSDTGPRRFLSIALIVVGIALVGYLALGDQLKDQFGFLKGQVTPVEQSLLDYLQTQPGAVGALNMAAITNVEDIEQQLIQTLLTHQSDFDTASVTAAQAYLNDYYGFTEPVPTELTQIIQASAQRFLQAIDLLSSGDTVTITPFINEILTIFANHNVSTNNYQAVQRSQTARRLLESLTKEL